MRREIKAQTLSRNNCYFFLREFLAPNKCWGKAKRGLCEMQVGDVETHLQRVRATSKLGQKYWDGCWW